MSEQQVDGPLGEQRCHRERHVGAGHDLLEHDPGEPREPAAAIGLGERDSSPAGLHVLRVGLLEPVGCGHRPIGVAHAGLLVAGCVEGRELVFEEPGGLLDRTDDGLDVEVREVGVPGDAIEVHDMIEHEADVVEGGRVVGHGRRI